MRLLHNVFQYLLLGLSYASWTASAVRPDDMRTTVEMSHKHMRLGAQETQREASLAETRSSMFRRRKATEVAPSPATPPVDETASAPAPGAAPEGGAPALPVAETAAAGPATPPGVPDVSSENIQRMQDADDLDHEKHELSDEKKEQIADIQKGYEDLAADSDAFNKEMHEEDHSVEGTIDAATQAQEKSTQVALQMHDYAADLHRLQKGAAGLINNIYVYHGKINAQVKKAVEDSSLPKLETYLEGYYLHKGGESRHNALGEDIRVLPERPSSEAEQHHTSGAAY